MPANKILNIDIIIFFNSFALKKKLHSKPTKKANSYFISKIFFLNFSNKKTVQNLDGFKLNR